MTCTFLPSQGKMSCNFDFAGSTAGVERRGYRITNDFRASQNPKHYVLFGDFINSPQVFSVSAIDSVNHDINSYASNTEMEATYFDKNLALSEVASLTKLEKNWDDEDGNPFTDEEVKLFLSVIEDLKKIPRLSPTGCSSLILDYEKKDGSYLGFELYIDRMDVVWVPENDFSRTTKFRVFHDFSKLVNAEIESFYA